MRTKRLVSTIGYNTEAFLASVLQRLYDSGVIEWAHYILHQPEEDEGKAHWHIVVQPSKAIDTRALAREFDEVDITKPGKPLTVQEFRFTKSLDDWLLYSIHDAGYLAAKAQTRQFHYAREDVRSTSPDLLLEQWHEVNLAKYGLGERLSQAVVRGFSWEQVVASGLIPPAQWTFWREVYYSMKGGASVSPIRSELSHTPKAKQRTRTKARSVEDSEEPDWSANFYD